MKGLTFHKTFICSFLMCLSFVAMPQRAAAQVDGIANEYDGAGITLDELKACWKGNEQSSTRVFIYSYGKKMFLNAGGYWGTRTATFTTGLPLICEPFDGGYATYFKIQGPFKSDEGGELMGLVLNDEKTQKRGTYFNRKDVEDDNNSTRWYIQPVRNNTSNKNLYQIMAEIGEEEYYLCSNNIMDIQAFKGGNTNLVRTLTNEEIQEKINDPNDSFTEKDTYWQFVTEKQLEDKFPYTYEMKDPADATFILRAQGFNHNNRFNIYDEEYKRGWRTEGTLEYTSDFSGEFLDKDGSDWSKKSDLDLHFGMFHCAGIKNAKAGAKLYQEAQIKRSGWYQVECQGFYNDKDGTIATSYAKLYAKVEGNPTENSPEFPSRPLLAKSPKEQDGSLDNIIFNEETFNKYPFLGEDTWTDGIVTNKVEAGAVFYNQAYPNQVMVYVNFDETQENPTKTLELGIMIDKNMESDDYVYVDDFRVKYLGESFALDEGWTDFKNGWNEEDEANNKPSDFESEYANRPLILKRTLLQDNWNSLVLPIALTKAQLHEAFSTSTRSVKIARIVGSAEQGALSFKTVNLNDYKDNDIVINRGEAFLIKPTKGNRVTTGSISIGDRGKTEIKAPFYTLSRSSLHKEEVTTTLPLGDNLSRFHALTYDNNNIQNNTHYPVQGMECKLNIFATFENGATAPKYAYTFQDGKCYYLPKDYPKQKGYSWWIEDEHQYDGSGAKPHKLALYFDGIQDGATAIEGITADITEGDITPAVYNLQGQAVRRGTTSLDGLPRGMYIVNGKKVSVL